METIIRIKNLSFKYSGVRNILDNINLTVGKGEVFGIIGPTGAGKSTLIQHLNGILKGDGEVNINGVKVEKSTEREVRKIVGLVFQNPDDQLFCPTVREDIAFGLYNLGLKGAEVERRVTDICQQLDLQGYLDKSSHHLSFGEKKRIALATTLVMEPQVLAMDEPFANLDYKSILMVIKIINSLAITRIIISQDILLSLSICDRIAVIDNGRIILSGTPEEILKDREVLAEIGLDFRCYMDLIRKLI